jgi:D-sedoheptulose 7-phosphate isomerase
MRHKIEKILKEFILTGQNLLVNKRQLKIIQELADASIRSLKKGGKIILFGNGGSAADAQHIAAELVGRFKRDRRSLAALAISTNTSILTALGNDYGFDTIFARQIEAIAKKEDLAIGISTSGNSPNVILGIKRAKQIGLKTAALTGNSGGKIAKLADIAIRAPSDNTPRVQEIHILVGHIICQLIEEALVGKPR